MSFSQKLTNMREIVTRSFPNTAAAAAYTSRYAMPETRHSYIAPYPTQRTQAGTRVPPSLATTRCLAPVYLKKKKKEPHTKSRNSKLSAGPPCNARTHARARLLSGSPLPFTPCPTHSRPRPRLSRRPVRRSSPRAPWSPPRTRTTSETRTSTDDTVKNTSMKQQHTIDSIQIQR